MESRIRSILLVPAYLMMAVSTALVSLPAYAANNEQVIVPEIDRRIINTPAIDTEDFEAGFFVGVMNVEDFETNPVYGIRAAYHISEDFFLEAAIGRTDAGLTSFEKLSGAATLLTDEERILTYYNLSVGYNILPGEAFVTNKRAYNTALYLIGGIGSTDFAGNNQFTINIGAGYRFLLTDSIALHIDIRDHIFDSDVLGEDKTTHNLEAHGGVTVFF